MIDIRDHGGAFGGGIKKPVHISKTAFKDSPAVFFERTNSYSFWGDRLMEPGLIMSVINGTYSNSYLLRFYKNGEILGSVEVTLRNSLSQSYPFSNVLKLPDGRYIFSHYGDLYVIAADRTSVTRVKEAGYYSNVGGTYDVASTYYVFRLFLSKAGKVIVCNQKNFFFILNPSTFAYEGRASTSQTTIASSGGFAYCPLNQFEDDDYVYVKDGDSGGNLLKISKTVTTSSNPLIFNGSYQNGYGMVEDGTYIYMNASSYLYKYSKATMSLVASYPTPSGAFELMTFYDSIAKKVYMGNYNGGYYFNTLTNSFETKYMSLRIENQGIYAGVLDPKTNSFWNSGRLFCYAFEELF